MLDDLPAPDVRQVKLYMLAVFHKGYEDKPVISCYNSTEELLDRWCHFRAHVPDVHVHTFTEYIYVAPGHPLYAKGEPVRTVNKTLRIHR